MGMFKLTNLMGQQFGDRKKKENWTQILGDNSLFQQQTGF